ncbi:ice-binding family protein, partial [Pseudonocardia sp. 73-21]|uniref:ice-binding family protein n=2 Tax=Pseudonocardia TaxID=1847 RepID=UPI000B18BC73
MKHSTQTRRGRVGAALGGAIALLTSVLMVVFSGSASAATAVPLGTAASFAVLAGQQVTNTGPSAISGDLGVSPGTAVTGFPPGLVNGSQHSADAVAAQAQSDLTVAYNNAAGQTPTTSVATELGGRTLTAGTYGNVTLGLTGTLTLDGQGQSDSVFLFQAGSTLITASNSSVVLINGANACNVFWQVGSSATLGTGTAFIGTILALTSISVQTGATVQGRALARNGSVTLDDNVITSTGCAPATPPTTTTTTAPPTTTTTAPPTTTTTAPPTTTTTAPPTTTTTAPPTTTTTAPPTTT